MQKLLHHAAINPAKLATISLLLVSIFWTSTFTNASQTSLDPVVDKPIASQLRLKNLNEEVIDLEQFRGRIVLVNFWAVWCTPCRAEMPSMQTLYEAFDREQLEVIAVDMGSKPSQIEEFLADTEPALEFKIVLDELGETARDWGVRGIPVSFVIDQQGRLVYQALGERDWSSEAMQQSLRKLIDVQ